MLVFSGEYDLLRRDELKRVCADLDTVPHVVLDLAKGTYIDSACLTEVLLLDRRREALAMPPKTVIVEPGSNVERLATGVNFAQIFRVVTKATDAIPEGHAIVSVYV